MSPAFQPSPVGAALTGYVDRQRALGFRYDNELGILQELDAFLAEHEHSALTARGFNSWTRTLEHLTPQGRRKKMRIVYRFTLHCRQTAPECFVPDPALFPSPSPAPAPWIFTERQILALLEQAGQLQSTPHSPLRAHVYRLAVVLLLCWKPICITVLPPIVNPLKPLIAALIAPAAARAPSHPESIVPTVKLVAAIDRPCPTGVLSASSKLSGR